MRQVDYSKLNQKYSISQLRGCPEYLALINADADLKENLQTVLFYLINFANIDVSSGFLLDFIGWLVGTSRDYFDLSQYFKINSPDVNVQKYIWFSEPATDFVAPRGSLADVYFRARIKAKIGANTSKCTREANINVIKNLTYADTVTITNPAPMLLDIKIKGKNLFLSQHLKDDIERVLGNGVGIRNLTTEIG